METPARRIVTIDKVPVQEAQRGGTDSRSSSTNPAIAPPRLDHVEDFFAARALGPKVELIVAEDNETAIKIIRKGRSAKMRRVHRTHRVDTDWLYEVFAEPEAVLRYVSTKHQIADMQTKAGTKADTWNHLLKLAAIVLESGGVLTVKSSIEGVRNTIAAKRRKNEELQSSIEDLGRAEAEALSDCGTGI